MTTDDLNAAPNANAVKLLTSAREKISAELSQVIVGQEQVIEEL